MTDDELQRLRRDIENAAVILAQASFPMQHLDRTESIRMVNHGRRLLAAYDAVRAERDRLRAAVDFAGRWMVHDVTPEGSRAYEDLLGMIEEEP